MTLNDLLLQKLASWRPALPRQTLTLDHADSGWKVEVVADVVETVGAKVWEVALRRTRPAETAVSLADQADRIAARVTGLMEPLRLVEVDTARDVAQLRSTAPAARGEALFYYEVLRHADGATTLRRFQAAATGPKREQVAFTLTHEAVAKLVADFAAV